MDIEDGEMDEQRCVCVCLLLSLISVTQHCRSVFFVIFSLSAVSLHAAVFCDVQMAYQSAYLYLHHLAVGKITRYSKDFFA